MTEKKGGNVLANIYGYMRISTKEERKKQKYTRQENALIRYEKENNIKILMVFKDDASGKDFNREDWLRLERIIQSGDTIIFKDIFRFTREYDNGYNKYMELLNKGINLVFIDNPTVSTGYIKSLMDVASKQNNRIAKQTLENTIQLLVLVELDRAEQEREVTVNRIKDGIAASEKKSGRKPGSLDKMSDALRLDIIAYNKDRTIKQIDLINKHNISRNTLKKYINIINNELNLNFFPQK